jgi:hypothetical protein
MFISFKKNECESDCITFGDSRQGQVLGFSKIAKLLLLPNIQFLKFFLLSRWTIICCPFHSFVRRAIIVCSPIRVDHL